MPLRFDPVTKLLGQDTGHDYSYKYSSCMRHNKHEISIFICADIDNFFYNSNNTYICKHNHIIHPVIHTLLSLVTLSLTYVTHDPRHVLVSDMSHREICPTVR